MNKRQMLLTNEPWELISPLLLEVKRRKGWTRSAPAPNLNCFEGILWILHTGAAWHFLPDEYPSLSTPLTAAEAAGGRGSLAHAMAHVAGHVG